MQTVSATAETAKPILMPRTASSCRSAPTAPSNGDRYIELGRLFADVLDRGYEIYHGKNGAPAAAPVVITGAALGLPGTEHIFDDGNIGRILRGDQFIDSIPTRFRHAMLDKHITRLVKSDNGEPRFETINDVADVIKLAGRGGAFDLENEFGVSAERVARPRPGHPTGDRRGHRRTCATPASRWSCAIRPRPKARNCRIAGDCPTLCATIPA